MAFFSYTKQHTEFLSKKDKELGAFISRCGYVKRRVYDDLFEGLCYNIVNQQLSMKACETLWAKLCDEFGAISPSNLNDSAALRKCGLSQSKADCIARCAQLFVSGELSQQALEAMQDDEVIRTLTAIKGIGRWTAQMVLIFCLKRPDVLSLSDHGIRKGISVLHDIDIKDTAAMEIYRELYSPCGTVASIYLWEAAKEQKEI